MQLSEYIKLQCIEYCKWITQTESQMDNEK